MPCHTQASWSRGHKSNEETKAIRNQQGQSDIPKNDLEPARNQVKTRKTNKKKTANLKSEGLQVQKSRQERGQIVATSALAQMIRIPSTSPFSPGIVSVPVDLVKPPGYMMEAQTL